MTPDEVDRALYKLLLGITTMVSTAVYAADGDGDGIEDGVDNCSSVVNADQLDTDNDDSGDVCDVDDDSDDVSDEQEAADGTDPLNRYSCKGCFDFDIDIDDETSALTDGLLVLRHLFGFSGTTLVDGAVTITAARPGTSAISNYLDTHATQLDIDGDERIDALTDGLLLLRYLFGFQGSSLIEDVRGSDATRATSAEITAYVRSRIDTGSNVTTNTFSRVQNLVFTPSCASVNCHKGGSRQYGLDLSSRNARSESGHPRQPQPELFGSKTRGGRRNRGADAPQWASLRIRFPAAGT